jgi:hypothetical protein
MVERALWMPRTELALWLGWAQARRVEQGWMLDRRILCRRGGHRLVFIEVFLIVIPAAGNQIQ